MKVAAEFCRAAGAGGVMAGSRIVQAMRASTFLGETWVITLREGALQALAWAGGNLILVGADAAAARALGTLARVRGGRYASIVGDAEAVAAFWAVVGPGWPQPRAYRENQLLLEAPASAPLSLDLAPDPDVKVATLDGLDPMVVACRAMFTEELGFPPPGLDSAYRAHVAGQVERGNLMVRTDPATGKVIFKAELGAELGRWVQIQGVWTDPAWRGRGIAKAGMAAVMAECARRGRDRVCLYVNHYNLPALAVYRALGFYQSRTWATIMF
ncbi:MAG: GNAT family N-acetyltransferase [Bifidobacteriaceae bacterium]|jgi:ribosomal protein S18 acetylase RimI-like enzyme|nr:GNAT family N-acetyltransferase [Bifidobacteriaceae bacterium]